MASLVDVCRFNPTLGGTTDWTYSTAVTGYQSPTAAGVVNGATYNYRAESSDLSQWEVGFGTYNTGTGVLTRTTVLFNSVGTTAKISFSAAPQVAIVALAEDLRVFPAPQGRLTLQTAEPVMAVNRSAKTTVYYTPYVGSLIPLYDGANMVPTAFSEISVATTDTAKNPAAIGASKVNDWFVWNDAGALRLTHGPDWTNDTTRSAGSALTMVNGIYLNNAAITNGPAASRGTYVGTTRSNSSSQLDWIVGGAGAAAFLYVWNAYNQVMTAVSVSDNAASWTYASATIRATNNGVLNRVSFVSGLALHGISANNQVLIRPAAAVSAVGEIGIALDGTAASDKQSRATNPTSSTMDLSASSAFTYAPQLGAHFVAGTENSDGTNTATYFGSSGRAFLTFSTMM
ncbi:hypothetical protein [Bradyrhizobium tunisiense]|uniref:hypothetical protein n=1 Tax=Bradyrhizobium tunisiense TaxID=3278709 RepID=UPI0035E2E4D6